MPNAIQNDLSDTPRRVLVVAPRLLPYSETFISQQAKAMDRWHPVLVGELHSNGDAKPEGLESLELCSSEDGILHGCKYRIARIFRNPDSSSIRRLGRVGASLLHAHFGTCAVDVWPLAKALNLPMMATLHGYDITTHRTWWESGRGGWRRIRYPEQLIRLSAEPSVQFLAVSNAIREQAIASGIPPEKVRVQYTGIDIEQFRPTGTPVSIRPRRVLFVGRLVEKKGVAHLVRAASRILPSVPGLQLRIVGDGPERQALERLAADLNIPSTFTGALSSEGVRQEINQARVLCLPSITGRSGDAEGFGMVLLEAQASGVPVITSARGGASEGVLDGATGFSVAEACEEQLADRMFRLLTDDQLLSSFSANASEFVREHFDLRVMTKQLQVKYDEHVAASATRTDEDHTRC